MLFGDGPKGNKFADPGIGENNIDSPLHVGDGLVKTIKVSQLGNVSLNSRNVDADCLPSWSFCLPFSVELGDDRADSETPRQNEKVLEFVWHYVPIGGFLNGRA
jgi:hypothetical protein